MPRTPSFLLLVLVSAQLATAITTYDGWINYGGCCNTATSSCNSGEYIMQSGVCTLVSQTGLAPYFRYTQLSSGGFTLDYACAASDCSQCNGTWTNTSTACLAIGGTFLTTYVINKQSTIRYSLFLGSQNGPDNYYCYTLDGLNTSIPVTEGPSGTCTPLGTSGLNSLSVAAAGSFRGTKFFCRDTACTNCRGAQRSQGLGGSTCYSPPTDICANSTLQVTLLSSSASSTAGAFSSTTTMGTSTSAATSLSAVGLALAVFVALLSWM